MPKNIIDLNVLTCPNCNEPFIMEKLNCGIFRHGVLHLFSFKTPIVDAKK